jgi:hypothetical protein
MEAFDVQRVKCRHISQESRKGESGLWCLECGAKVYDVEERRCGDCSHSQTLLDGLICKKHLMSIAFDVNVTFKVSKGSCWTAPVRTKETSNEL